MTLDQLLVDSQSELRRYLRQRFGCDMLAAEAVQDACVRLSGAGRPATGTVRHPRAYIFRVATNIALDILRRETRERRRFVALDDAPEAVEVPVPSVERSIEQRERLALLRGAIDELPPRCREVFVLHKLDGLSHADVAERLGISRNMVEKHVIRAMRHFRDRLDAAGHDG